MKSSKEYPRSVLMLNLDEWVAVINAIRDDMQNAESRAHDDPKNFHWQRKASILKGVIERMENDLDEKTESRDRELLREFLLAGEDKETAGFALRNLFLKVKEHLQSQ